MESFQCGHHSFCNFDFHSSGYCESCISLEEGDCENMGLITNKGEQECQGICKGIREASKIYIARISIVINVYNL